MGEQTLGLRLEKTLEWGLCFRWMVYGVIEASAINIGGAEGILA